MPCASEALVVVTLKGATEIVILKLVVDTCCVGVSESVTLAVKLTGPTNVPFGVPESAPVVELIESQDGFPLRLQV